VNGEAKHSADGNVNVIAEGDGALLSRAELRARMEQLGEERYHHKHPFHLRMHRGELTRAQLQAWALNRYYYQRSIPIKDAFVLAKSDDPDFRRAWRKRILDHDGDRGNGGIEKWLQLAEACGVARERCASCREVLPGVRFAVDAYVNLVKESPLLIAVASSLTELFSSRLISLRMDKLREHYPWLSHGLAYFEGRMHQAPEDAAFAFNYVAENARTRAEQESALAALRTKCDILWAQLDSIYYAYVEPGWPAPGSFQPAAEEMHGGEEGNA